MKLIKKIFLVAITCLLLPSMMMAQKTLSGTITDAESGEPLIGASLLVNGTTTGTVTDIDGNYSLTIPDGYDLLTISYTGYAPIEKNIGNLSRLDVQMSAGEVLDEVVVIGYGTIKKEDATGSVQTVSSEKFNKGAITGPQELLAGKVAGVSISTNSGAPGAGAKIRIRGESSISANNDPLIVIDGVPLESGGVNGSRNPLNIINPNDIETFTVLKDASASAIYGNRAAGGVIIITTKKGSVGNKLRVGYNGNVSVGTIAEKMDVLDARSFTSLIQNQYGEGHPAVTALGTESTDWQEEIYQNAIGHDHNLSFAGAVKSLPYRVSLGYTDKNGILKSDNFNRLTAGINLSPGFLDNRLQLNIGLKGMRTKNQFANRGAIGSALAFDPTKPVRDEESPFGGFWTWRQADGNPNALAPSNPVALLELTDDQSTVKRYIANFQVDYRFSFLPALRANLNLAYDKIDAEGGVDIPAEASFAFYDGGVIREYTQGKENELLEFYLNYKKDIGANTIDLMAGYSWQHFFEERFGQASNIAGTDIIQAPNNDSEEHYLVSLFGRLNYSYDDRYLLTATLRRDGTSRFSPDNRYGLFPSVALGIKLLNDETARGLSNLKLRLGWGVTGQEAIGDRYAYLSRYQAGFDNAQYQFGNDFINTLRPNGYDAAIKWEETTTYNAALDFGVIQNKLTGTLEIYQRNTKDLLNFVPVPAGTNLTNFITTNVGDLENRGIELSLNATPILKEDQQLDLGFNIAYNENEITRLTATDDPNYQGVLTGNIAGGVGSTIQIHSVGFPANSYYVWEQVYDEQGVPIEGLYVDRNQDGVINGDDQYRYKNPSPDFSIGFTARYEIKDFDISFAGRSQIGNYVYNNVWSDQAFYNRLFNSTGVISNANSVIGQIDFTNPQYFSDHFVRDASFLRIDHITLGYNFDELIGDFTRFYMTIQNPIVLSNYEGIDPEVINDRFNGVDNNIYPRPRTFVFGVSVDF